MSQLAFDFGVATFSEYDSEDGHLGISFDHPGENAGVPPAEAFSPFGFISRPLDPEADAEATPTTGCTVFLVQDGDAHHLMPLQDPRVTEILPQVRKGGAMFYCAAGSYALWDGVDPNGINRPGSLTISAKYGDKSHLLTMNVRKDGKEDIQFRHGEGHGLVATAGGKKSALLRNAAGTAYFETNDDGNVIAGKTKVQGPLTVGDQAAAANGEVALAKPLLAALAAMAAAAGPAAASMTAALTPFTALIVAKQLKTT